MKRFFILVFLVVFFVVVLCGVGVGAERVLTLATTTSTENSGLLEVIHPVFEKRTGVKVKVIALGTGAAIKTAEEGNCDVILVHAPSREARFVAEGHGVERFAVMHNDFVILGPTGDPAGIRGMTDAGKALAKIAEAGSVFVSRGDDSGTHLKEQDLWKASGVELIEISRRITMKGKQRTVIAVEPEQKGEHKWYLAVGMGMGNVINFAFEKQGYALADRGTYLAYKKNVDLEVLVEGDERLFNPYGVIAVNPQKHKHVQADLAKKYIEWLLSPEGQKLIGEFKIEGEVLFHPDVVKSFE